MSQIIENFAAVQRQIKKAERTAGRAEGSTQLVAVTKTQSLENLRDAIAAGQKVFGENRVQEALEHWEGLKKEFPDIVLHLIGPLQTNKVKEAIALFDCIETLDREKLADALAGEMKKQGRHLPCLVQVNTGEEEQKAGISPSGLPAFLAYCKNLGLDIRGLMCIPPADEPAGLHFAFLKKLAQENNLPQLSMGMSADFEKAIALGATHIRVGTALFGLR